MIPTAVLAADYAGTLDMRDTSTVSVRANQPAPIVAQGKVILAMDLSTLPEARLRLVDRRWEYTASYSPTFTALDVELGFNGQALHAGGTSVSWHDHFALLTLSESASYGTVNTAYFYALPAASQPTASQPTTSPPMAGQPPAASRPAPMQTSSSGAATCNGRQICPIDYGSSDTNGSIGLRLGRRATLSLTGGYLVSGGMTTVAQLVLPKQEGPRATTSVGYALSRRNGLDTVASAQELFTSGGCAPPLPPMQFCSERAAIFELQERLRHQASPATSVSLSAGVAASVVEVPKNEAIVQPVAVATLTRRFHEHGTTSLHLAAQLGPVVDFRTGIPSERFQASASLAEAVAPRSTLTFTAAALQSVPVPISDPNPLTVISAAVEARVALDRRLDVAVGALEFWQNQMGYGALESTICYVSVSGRAPTLRF